MDAGDSEPGFAELLSQLAGDAHEVARAEIALAKARAIDRAERYKVAAILFAVAGTLGLAGLVALLIGLIAILSPLVGSAIATLIVTGTVFILAIVLGLAGKARLDETRKR